MQIKGGGLHTLFKDMFGLNPPPKTAVYAFDLLCKMLDPDPNTRITAADAIKHEWFQGND